MIEQQGLDPLLNILRKLGGWPILENQWNETEFNWKESVYKFRKMGYSVDYFIDFSIGVDLKNSTKRIIDVRIHERTPRSMKFTRRRKIVISRIGSKSLQIKLN